MKTIANFVRNTLVGGILFLVPIIVLAALLGKAHAVAQKIVKPLADLAPFESVIGLDTPRFFAVLLLVLFCFLAGLFAKTAVARRFGDSLENGVLSRIPGYTLVKGMAEGMVGADRSLAKEVVLARIEDSWQIGFVVERIAPDHAAVFVPGSPDPKSGSVYFMGSDRIKPIDVPMASAIQVLKDVGKNSSRVLGGKL
jgi:uncharacterized membrane protein